MTLWLKRKGGGRRGGSGSVLYVRTGGGPVKGECGQILARLSKRTNPGDICPDCVQEE